MLMLKKEKNVWRTNTSERTMFQSVSEKEGISTDKTPVRLRQRPRDRIMSVHTQSFEEERVRQTRRSFGMALWYKAARLCDRPTLHWRKTVLACRRHLSVPRDVVPPYHEPVLQGPRQEICPYQDRHLKRAAQPSRQ